MSPGTVHHLGLLLLRRLCVLQNTSQALVERDRVPELDESVRAGVRFDGEGLAVLAEVKVGAITMSALEPRSGDLLATRIATSMVNCPVRIMMAPDHDVLGVPDPHERMLGVLLHDDAVAALADVVVGAHAALVPVAVDLAVAQVACGVVRDELRAGSDGGYGDVRSIPVESTGCAARFLGSRTGMMRSSCESTSSSEMSASAKGSAMVRMMTEGRATVVGTREGTSNVMDDNLARLLELVEFVTGIMLVALGSEALVAHVVVGAIEALVPATDDGLSADVARRVVSRRRSGSRSDWFGNSLEGVGLVELYIMDDGAVVVFSHAGFAKIEVWALLAPVSNSLDDAVAVIADHAGMNDRLGGGAGGIERARNVADRRKGTIRSEWRPVWLNWGRGIHRVSTVLSTKVVGDGLLEVLEEAVHHALDFGLGSVDGAAG